MSSPEDDEPLDWLEETQERWAEQPAFAEMPPDSGGFGAGSVFYSLYQGEDHGLVKNVRLAQLILTLEHGFNRMSLDLEVFKNAMASVDPRSVPQAERDRLLEIYDRLTGLVCVQRIFFENEWMTRSSLLRPISVEMRAFAQQLTNPLAGDPAFFRQ